MKKNDYFKSRRDFLKSGAAAGALFAVPFGAVTENRDTEMPRYNLTGYRKRVTVGEHPFNGSYTGDHMDRIAFPIGGIGAGMFCMEGTGSISHLSVDHRPDIHNEPFAFAAISIPGLKNGAKVLEAPVPLWKLFGQPGTGNGLGNKNYGLPRFQSGNFLPRFPFATLQLQDDDIPLHTEVTGWSPFIPTDDDNSSLPAGGFEYRFRNTGNHRVKAVFSYNAKNFIDTHGRILKANNGFQLVKAGIETEEAPTGFTIYVDDTNAVTDYCWFRGGWFDPLTILWKNISSGNVVSNDPVDEISPGASIYLPFELNPGEEKTVVVNFCWYLPKTTLAAGTPINPGPAFGEKPSSGTALGQQEVSGFAGRQLVNTFDPRGDGQTGTLQSPPLTLSKRYLKFLIGGGMDKEKTAVRLLVDGKIVHTASGYNSEQLSEAIWDLQNYRNKKAVIQIVDDAGGSWGHVLADQFVLTNNPDENLRNLSSDAVLIADFENDSYNQWEKLNQSDEARQTLKNGMYYRPWYATRYKNLKEVTDYWNQNYSKLKQNSEKFRDAFFASTLPPEVTESVAANLTILKSPTVLRQSDGRLWGWEGCSDNAGCCAGSCTHVWNYAQAVPHLFPALERSLRETEFEVNQDGEGHQVFRATLPITKPLHDFHAASDGQLGGIMKVYRDWRISGDTQWLAGLYPKLKQSIDYCIKTWDPKHKGYLEEPHHNTYDIEFWGPDGMCTSFYLGALTAFIEISKVLDKQSDFYSSLLNKGKAYMENELFNGEYFIQKIIWTGLETPDPVKAQSFHTGYSEEALEILKKEGPKYQYGQGCLSDGILGIWLASVCGLPEIIDSEKVKSHLLSIHKYNLLKDLSDHDNPQRPTYACGSEGGLLLCTWPKGGELSLPFVYSNEVWTGIEYQVAGHLMFKGEVDKGLEIVRECRKRYDGVVRNPFDEYECGHWYARAMSSYGMLQALTGVRYDAVDKTLHMDTRVGDFTSFLSTHTGFGTAGLKNGEPFVEVYYGNIDINKVFVANKESSLIKA